MFATKSGKPFASTMGPFHFYGLGRGVLVDGFHVREVSKPKFPIAMGTRLRAPIGNKVHWGTNNNPMVTKPRTMLVTPI